MIFLAEAFTRAEDDGEAGRGRLHPELHVLHVAARASGSSSEYLERAGPRARSPTTCARTSGRTRPTSSPGRCATGRRRRSRCGSCWPPRMAPTYGIYSGYELCENEPASRRPTRSTSTRRSTSSSTRDWDRRRLARAVHHAVNDGPPRATRRFSELRTIRFHDADNDAAHRPTRRPTRRRRRRRAVRGQPRPRTAPRRPRSALDLGGARPAWDADLRGRTTS